MTLRRYERYKDSGAEWLGAVPAHWDVFQLRRVINRIEQGWSPECESRPAEEGEWGVLKTGCVNGGRFNSLENKALPSHLEAPPELEVAPDDLLMSRASGSPDLVGSAALVTVTPTRLLLSDKTFRLHVNQRANKQFLAWCLGSRPLRAQIECAISGAAGLANNLPQSSLFEFVAAFPPLLEQRAVAGYLDHETARIDTLIAEQQRLIELLTEKRQAVIAHAVTRGLNPAAPMKDSGVEWLGVVPAHWNVQPLKHVAAFRSGGTPDKGRLDYWDGDVPWASAKDLKVDDLYDTADHITADALEAGAASLVPAGSVLVVVRGMILARMFPVVTAMVPMAINQDLKAVTVRDHANAAFLAWLLRASASESLSRLDEAGHGTKALRMDAWGAMRVPVPPLGEQVQIAGHLKQTCAVVDAGLGDILRGIALLQERRTALISAAVTGQIDVRGAEAVESSPRSLLLQHD